MSVIRACIYDGDDRPVLILDGSPRQINAQLSAGDGRTWRAISDAVIGLDDAPALAALDRPAELPSDRR